MDKTAKHLRIQIEEEKTILANFEVTRDFNVAVCMLRKLGFHVKDASSKPPRKKASRKRKSPATAIEEPLNFGPRLSSITPLVGTEFHGESLCHQDLSFTSILNSPSMPMSPDYLIPYATQPYSNATPAQTHHSPQYQTEFSQQGPYMTSLNPYEAFLGRQTNPTYRPHVASPLRNSFQAWEDINKGESFESPPTTISQSDWPSFTPTIGSCTEQTYTFHSSSAEASQDSTSSPNDSQSSNLTEASSANDSTQNSASESPRDFRKLMPQPRKLPFIRRIEKKMDSRSLSVTQHAAQTQAGDHGEFANEPFQLNRRNLLRTCSEAHEATESRQPLEKRAQMVNAGSQTELFPNTLAPAHFSQQLTGENHASHHKLDRGTSIFVADPSLIRQAGEVANRFLEQYETDVARGCDEHICAKFYMEQIDAARSAFWRYNLADKDGQNRLTIV